MLDICDGNHMMANKDQKVECLECDGNGSLRFTEQDDLIYYWEEELGLRDPEDRAELIALLKDIDIYGVAEVECGGCDGTGYVWIEN